MTAADVAAALDRHLAGEWDGAALERWAEVAEQDPLAAAAPAEVRDALEYLARPPFCGPARRKALEALRDRLRRF